MRRGSVSIREKRMRHEKGGGSTRRQKRGPMSVHGIASMVAADAKVQGLTDTKALSKPAGRQRSRCQRRIVVEPDAHLTDAAHSDDSETSRLQHLGALPQNRLDEEPIGTFGHAGLRAVVQPRLLQAAGAQLLLVGGDGATPDTRRLEHEARTAVALLHDDDLHRSIKHRA